MKYRVNTFYRYGFMVFAFFAFANVSMATGPIINRYVDQYKSIAIAEMHRTGIPASIKMAQALLESDFGRSDLALTANNHFGIKCGGSWTGRTFYKEDDDRNKDGDLIESCFRSYLTGEESFIAHSKFLASTKKGYRYGFLFEFGSTDYHSWAHGLKKSGYATDPKYPQKLIKIIEDNELYLMDEDVFGRGNSRAVAEYKSEKVEEIKIKESVAAVNFDEMEILAEAKNKVRIRKPRYKKINGSRATVVMDGDTPESISKRERVSYRKLSIYNENIISKNQELNEGDLVFLKAKKKDYQGYKKTHRVRNGETMQDIANQYGIWLNELYVKNRMPKGSQALKGEQIVLKGLVKIKKRPKFKTESEYLNETQEYLFEGEEITMAN